MTTKTFAQQSRKLLMDGVSRKLIYWGFSPNGEVLEQPDAVSGGYTFRGEAFDDDNVPALWQSLKKAVQKKGIEVVVEEAAYTWFNRLMAIRILAKNGYDLPQLDFADGLNNTPILLQKARQGQYNFLNAAEKKRLQRIIGDYNKENDAFALLLVGYCHSHNTLNKVFGKLDDYTELLLPDNMLQDQGFLNLLNTTDAISDAEYKEVELIGWLYQFYISERKDEVFTSFKKKKKAEAKDIPAATQIFTPNWIVKYMVENTAGKIWLDHKPDSAIKDQMKYLVTNQNISSSVEMSPRAQSRDLITDVEELTLIDPACGSGHILVEGFDLLYKMYQEEYYTPEEAVQTIFSKNLYGLDIDDRAAQLASFAVLLKAAQVYPDVWSKDWKLNIYAMPEANDFSTQEVEDFLGDEGKEHIEALEKALQLMQQAKNLGSVMQLNLSEESLALITERYEYLQIQEHLPFELQTIKPKLEQYIPVLITLSRKFTAVVANPPYLGYKFLNGVLKQYVESTYPNTKSDLFAVFQEVLSIIGEKNGKRGLINQWAWMCIDSYKYFRENFIANYHIESLLHLGIGVFKEMNTKKVQNVALIFSDKLASSGYSKCYKLDETFDVQEKERLFLNNKNIYSIDVTKLTVIPNTPLAFWFNDEFIEIYKNEDTFDAVVSPRVGLQTGNNDRFVRYWYEVDLKQIGVNFSDSLEAELSLKKWFPYNKGGGYNKWYGNNYYILNWENNGCEIKSTKPKAVIRNESFYFQEGVSWSLISLNFSARYTDKGYLFDVGGSSGFPKTDDLFYSIALLNSKVSSYILAGLNFTLNVQVGDIKRILYVNPNRDKKLEIEKVTKKIISLSKEDFDFSEMSRDFETNIIIKQEANNLEKSFEKSVNHINESVKLFYEYEKFLNQKFIELYKLENELTAEPDTKYLTLYESYIENIEIENNKLSLEFNKSNIFIDLINYAVGLFMGRYRLNKPGLNIAHPNPTQEELASYSYNSGQVIIDEDAIVPLMGTRANFKDDALYQIQELLDTIWGKETRTENLNFLQDGLNKDLEKYLLKDFWKDHCKVYKKKPIYWLFSSKKGAFQVLVYMHRMNAFTVEKIRANYLLEHLKHLNTSIAALEKEEANLNTQQGRKLDQLRKDLRECEEYDMLLKDAADNQIVFDLDNGVTENYKLFDGVVAKIK